MNEGEPRIATCDQCHKNKCKPYRTGRRDFVHICKSCWNELPKSTKENLTKDHKNSNKKLKA